MWSLRQRRRRPEVMDQPGLDPEQHARALRGLARINFWSGSARIFWPPLDALARRLAPRPLRVLDLASGGGDVALRLQQRARKAGLPLQVEGCDLSATAVAHAQAAASAAGVEVHFFVHDVLDGPLPAGYDALISSLFLHHLEEEQARALLRKMAEAAHHLVLINDLERSWAGLALAHIGARLLSRSAVVHIDGPRSVEGAFTVAEARHLAAEAGLAGAVVRRRWPCRYLLSWSRT